MRSLLKPRSLRPGDVLGLVAPAGAVWDGSRIDGAVRYLESRGYRVEVAPHARGNDGAFAGSDEARVSDLNAFFRDPRIRGIFALRGGYGTPRLLDRIDYRAVRRDPKVVVGYSDITALQMALFRRTGLVTFSGPLSAVEFAAGPDPYTEEQFWQEVTSGWRPGPLPLPAGSRLIPEFDGIAEGPLLGGCLSLVVSLLGTPFCPDFRGSLLVLEDVHEHLHRIDRMLTQLRLARVLQRSAGIVLGQFTDTGPAVPSRPHHSLQEILTAVFQDVAVPRVSGFPYGHIPRKATLPLGIRTRLDTRAGTVEFLEAAVSG